MSTWWMEEAACTDPAMAGWWDVEGQVLSVHNQRAIGACRSCPVFEQCRAFADELETRSTTRDIAAIFAGETPAQRVARRNKRPAPVLVAGVCGSCGRPMRAHSASLEKFPGTVPRATTSECRTCWGRDPARQAEARAKKQERQSRRAKAKAA
jgi:hypothetical protein